MRKILLKTVFVSLLTTAAFAKPGDEKALVIYKGPSNNLPRSLPFPWDMTALKSNLKMPFVMGGYDTLRDDVMPFAKMVRANLAKDQDLMIMNDLLPQALKVRAYVERMAPKYPALKFFLAEIDFKIAGEAIDPVWLSFLGMRIAAAMSGTPSKEALTLFSAFGGNKIDASIRKNYKAEGASFAQFTQALDEIDEKADRDETTPEKTFFEQTHSLRVEKTEHGYVIPEWAHNCELLTSTPDNPIMPSVSVKADEFFTQGKLTVKATYDPSATFTDSAFDFSYNDGLEAVFAPLYGRSKMGLATLTEAFVNSVYPYGVSSLENHAHGIAMTPFLFAFHDWLHGRADDSEKDDAIMGFIGDKSVEFAGEKTHLREPIAVEVGKFVKVKSEMFIGATNRLLDTYLKHFAVTQDQDFLVKAMIGFFTMVHEDFDMEPDDLKINTFADFIENLAIRAYEATKENDSFMITNDSSFTEKGVTEEGEPNNAMKMAYIEEDIAGMLKYVGFNLEAPTFTGNSETDKELAEAYMGAAQEKLLECIAFFKDTARHLIENDAEMGQGFETASKRLNYKSLRAIKAIIQNDNQ